MENFQKRKSNINLFKKETRQMLWLLQNLIELQGLSLKDLFKQFDQNGLLYFKDFCKIMRIIDNDIQEDKIMQIFKEIDLDNNNSLNFLEVRQIFDSIDKVKDSPFYCENQKQNGQKKEQEQIKPKKNKVNSQKNNDQVQKNIWDSLISKFEKIREKHLKKEINLIDFFQEDEQKNISVVIIESIMEICGFELSKQEQEEFELVFGKEDMEKNVFLNDILNLNEKKEKSQIKSQKSKQKMNSNNNNYNNNNNIIRNGLQNNFEDLSINNNNPSQLQLQKKKSESYIYNFDDFYEINEIIPGINEFLNVFEGCQQSEENFVDPTFPPAAQSISNDQNDLKYYPQRGQYVWRRPNENFSGQIYIFQKTKSLMSSRVGMGKYISPRDIKQGQLGDCYFLSAVSSMADKPERIFKLFITKIYNYYGVYCVKLCHDGEWKAVMVDDHFPCFNKYSGPAFSKANGNELWVLILEKAYAKLYGSYQRIESGQSSDAFRDLTGAPTYNVFTQDHETGNFNSKLYDELMLALQIGDYIVTAGSFSNIDSSIQERMGLVGSHAYSVISITNIYHPILKEITLVKLRNPWGKTEWKGDFSDNSKLWTPELKKQFKVSNANDGIFYMNLFDFQKFFDSCAVCCYHDDYIYNSFKINSNWKKAKYFRFEVKEEGLYYITMTQKGKRNFPKHNDHKYSNMRLLFCKILPDQSFKFYDSKQSCSKDVTVQGHLTSGVYYIYAKSEWIGDKNQDFVLGLYGPDHVQIENVDKQLLNNMVASSLKTKASNSGKLKPYSHNPYVQRCYDFDQKEGFGYVYITNQSDKIQKSTFTFDIGYGLKVRKPHKSFQIQFQVNPMSDDIATFTVGNQGYQYKVSEQYNVN